MEKKKKILKIVLLFGILILISCLICLALFLTNVIYWDNGTGFNQELFSVIKGKWYSWLIFLILQIIFTTLLCFAPGGSMSFILVGVALFGANRKTFILCFSGVLISSITMDLLGRFGGVKVIKWLVGEEDYNKADILIKNKGISYIPLMYLFPLFPDDAICMVAGMLKVNPLFHYLSILICRGIGVATIVFGISLIPYQEFTTLYDWLICITVCAVWVIIAFKLATRVNIYLEKKWKKNNIDKKFETKIEEKNKEEK